MKKGWKKEPLGELCEFQRGLTYAKSDEVESSDNIVLRANNINLATNLFDFTELRYISDSVFVPENKKVKKGSLIICTASGSKSHLGKVAYINANYDYAFGGFMGMITPKNDLIPRFLFHIMTSDAYKDFIGELSGGTNINNLTFDNLKKFPIPHPPIPEQQRIVRILDDAFESITTAKTNAEKNLQNARDVFESYLEAVFIQRGEGWVEKPLAELCDATRVITYGVIKLGDEVPDGIPCLRTSNVRWLRIETEGMKRIAPALSSAYSRTILKGGEVLVNVRGTLGGVAVATLEMAGWNVSREVAVVPVDPKRINPAFLSYLIGSGVSQQWLGDVQKGAAYIGVNIEDLRLLPVSAPNLEKQLEVVRYIELLQEETQNLESIYQRKLAALEELKKSLLHQAFNGEL
jgi:type I restriction enzyme, S subunit